MFNVHIVLIHVFGEIPNIQMLKICLIMSLFHVSSIRRNEKDILCKFKFVYLHNIWVRVATFTTSHHLQEKSSK